MALFIQTPKPVLIEYAHNTGMGDTDDTTNFSNTEGGTLVPVVAYTANRTKLCRFPTAITSSDVIMFQVDPRGDGKWRNIPGHWDNGSLNHTDFAFHGVAAGFGMGRMNETGSLAATDIEVEFGQYRVPTTYAGAGDAWNAADTCKWRLVKYSF